MPLLEPISDKEIEAVVFSIGSNRAPGSDGVTGSFFKDYWNIISDDLIAAVKLFFTIDCIPPSLKDCILAQVVFY